MMDFVLGLAGKSANPPKQIPNQYFILYSSIFSMLCTSHLNTRLECPAGRLHHRLAGHSSLPQHISTPNNALQHRCHLDY